MRAIPRSGEFYRHFKDKMYQIITIAKHSETGENLVIYQALYGDYKTYARPLSMFLSEVDKEKYPNASQTYRFEQVTFENGQEGLEQTILPAAQQTREHIISEAGQESDGNETVEPSLMTFLDTNSSEERYQILVSMRNIITDTLIDHMAVVLDVVIPDGDVMKRYEALKNCLKTKIQYEKTRDR